MSAPTTGVVPTHTIATAGHVDHGKSTLVRRLTGTDPDRWAAEKERGLTIDLGFARLDLPSGRAVSFVDVPGHIRFLTNMLSGVGAVDAAVLVVDANEGWMPQTEEHLRILDLLGLHHGLVVITKVGVADPDVVELAHLEVLERTEATFLDGAEVMAVDSIDGTGIDELVAALDRLAATTPRATDHERARLWIDRSFAKAGAGTVVTGTLTGGRLTVGDAVTIEPGHLPARVRGLQSHGVTVEVADPGPRLAVNLLDVDHHVIGRGRAVVAPGRWHVTDHVDARVTVLADAGHQVSRRGAHVVHVGSGRFPARLRVLGPHPLEPGQSGAVRIRLAEALPLVPGDRFVLRDTGRDATVGGGEILDVSPILRAADARPDRSVARVVAERGWVDVDELTRLTGEVRPADLGRWVVDPDALAARVDAVADAVADAGELGLDVARLDERDRCVVDHLVAEGTVVLTDGRARATDAADPLADHPWVAALAASPFRPPAPDGVERAEVSELVRRGLVVASEGVWFHPDAIDQAAHVVAEILAEQPEGFTVATLRDALDTTRKWILPLLAVLDTSGITRRRGDLRIGGARLPSP